MRGIVVIFAGETYCKLVKMTSRSSFLSRFNQLKELKYLLQGAEFGKSIISFWLLKVLAKYLVPAEVKGKSMFLSFFFSCENVDAFQLIWDYHDTVEKARTINTVIKKDE